MRRLEIEERTTDSLLARLLPRAVLKQVCDEPLFLVCGALQIFGRSVKGCSAGKQV